MTQSRPPNGQYFTQKNQGQFDPDFSVTAFMFCYYGSYLPFCSPGRVCVKQTVGWDTFLLTNGNITFNQNGEKGVIMWSRPISW